nr:CDGSH iron-sulfur domain-containing protein [uncultured Holophaga sp.]
MSEPKIVDTKPVAVELEPGAYYWCACGRSAKHPFCDGSHKDTGLSPVPFTLEAAQTVHLCACKQSGKKPFCDGSHRNL